jgi:hypothetical protein
VSVRTCHFCTSCIFLLLSLRKLRLALPYIVFLYLPCCRTLFSFASLYLLGSLRVLARLKEKINLRCRVLDRPPTTLPNSTQTQTRLDSTHSHLILLTSLNVLLCLSVIIWISYVHHFLPDIWTSQLALLWSIRYYLLWDPVFVLILHLTHHRHCHLS